MKKYSVFLTLAFVLFSLQTFAQDKTTSYVEPRASVLATGNWFKLGVEKTGIYKLTYADLQTLGVVVEGLKSKDIAIFGNGGGMLPEDNTVARYNDLAENAIYIVDDGKGNFTSSSYILFYGESPNNWICDTVNKRFNYNIHMYSKKNFYFLGIAENLGTKRIQTQLQSGVAPTKEITEFNDYIVNKEELVNPIQSGRDWFGKEFKQGLSNYPFTINLKDVVVGSNISLYLSVGARSEKESSFTSKFNNVALTPLILNALTSRPNERASTGKNSFDLTAEKSSNNLDLTYNFSEGNAKGWLERYEINFLRNLKLSDEQMNFRSIASVEAGSISKFKISNANNRTKVWDVSNPIQPQEIQGNLANNTFDFTTTTDVLKEFVVFNGNSSLIPQLVGKVENQNLHATPQKDYLIVTHPNFLEQAKQFDTLHKTYNNLDAVVVTTEQIYNEFSSGVQDPIAIRAFAKMFFDRAKAGEGKEPKYLLLLGCGTYDHKNIVANNKRQFVVVYQTAAGIVDYEANEANDDMFGFLENVSGSRAMNIGIGRLPVTTVKEAEVMFDKSKRYLLQKDITEDHSNGDWRNVITLIADDPDADRNKFKLEFFDNCQYLDNQLSTAYPNINVEKIYADAYKVTSSAIGNYYPDAVNNINQRVNKGTLMIDYVGHGADQYLGHERYVTQTSIANWTNRNKLAVLVTNTCQYARFDNTFDGNGKSGGEDITLHPNGGCIAVFSSTRKIYNDNSLNAAFFTNALSFENGKPLTFGEVMRNVKNSFKTNSSIYAYVLLGDPALNLPLTKNGVNTLKINSKIVSEEIDTINALANVTIEGELINSNNKKLDNFSGNLYITVYDKPIQISTLGNVNKDDIRTFKQQKSLLYKGLTKVENGNFSFTFTVPKDIAYQYGYGKLSYYAQNDSMQATGYCNEFVVGGINQDAEPDTSAIPKIKLYLNDTNFYSGGVTDANPIIFAVLSDKYGINMTGAGIGHDIVALLDGNVNNPIVLNDFYVVDENDPKKGYVAYPLSGLSEGTHTLELTAWNIYNVSAKTTITFQVKSNSSLTLGDFHAYPNPFKEYITFALEENQPQNIKSADLLIYNMQGQVVRKFPMPIDKGSFILGPVQWDGTSSGGARLSSGIFVARIIVENNNGDKQTITQKIMMLPQ